MKYLIILAVFPALWLMFYIYRLDKIEKEPIGMLIKLLMGGAITVISAMLLEMLGENIVGRFFQGGTTAYNAILCFCVVACSEELGKFLVLKKITWRSEEFNYQFDAVVYAVSASLGFAIFENVLYVMDGGISVALLRAVTAVPCHMINGVFMGHYYGKARMYLNIGNKVRSRYHLVKALLVPILLHGFYDFAAFEKSDWMTVVFFVFTFGLEFIAYKKLKRFSSGDARIAVAKEEEVAEQKDELRSELQDSEKE